MNKFSFYAFTLGAVLALPLIACGGDDNSEVAPETPVVVDGGIDTDASATDDAGACVSPALDVTCAGKCGDVVDACGETVDCKVGEFCDADQNCLAIDASKRLGECVDKCTADDGCKNPASCQTQSGICVDEGSRCIVHNDCGDSQICDTSTLDGIYGQCAKGERPVDPPACGEPSLALRGTDCASGMAMDIDDPIIGGEISVCTCECTSDAECPKTLPKCNAYLGMCISPQ